MKKLFIVFLLTIISSLSFAQLSGTYYIGAVPGSRPGGGDPEFVRLGKAFDSLNTVGVSGPCTFYFLDASYTEAANIALACTGTSATNTILFKPYTGVVTNIHFTQLADNTGPSARIVFGSNTIAAYTLVTMDYVTFDGSNTVGGTTRDLSITEVNNTPTFQYGIRFVGDVNNFNLKNVKITISETSGGSSYGVLVTPRNQSATDYIPDYITVDNCEVVITGGGACQGMSIGASGTLLGPNYPTGIVFRNNKITARTRGFFLSTGTGDVDIYGNEIYVNQTNTSTLSQGIYAFSVASPTKVINIYKNKFMQLQTANNAVGDWGILGIFIGTQGIYNIYNNLITNFSTTTVAANPSCVVEGIRVSTATVNGITTNFYHNTVVIPDLTIVPGTGTVIPKAFYLNFSGASGTRAADLKNNIFASQEDDFLSYSMVWRDTTSGEAVTSNYNDLSFVTNGKAGLYNATDCNALSDWQTNASLDANSISSDPLFVASADFHLQGSSPCINAGTNAGIATDLDGNPRPEPSGTLYDIGAYEYQAAPAPPAPVANAATNIYYTNFSANWSSSAGATSYQLDVALDNGFTSFVSGYNNLNVGNVTTYSITGLNDNTPYYYRVRAYNGLASGNSNTITLTTLQMISYSGTYYVGASGTAPRPGESDPNFSTIKDACNALNQGKITGNVTMYITSNITEPVNAALGVNTGSYTITFKPYTGVTPTINFTQTSDNSGPSGQWVIGSKSTSSWDSLVAITNVIIDGSNTNGGTTRDLTFTNVENDVTYNYGIRIVGNADNITLKNFNITITEAGNTVNSTYGINFAARGSLIPDNGIVDNCNITVTESPTGQGISITPSTTPSTGLTSTGMIFRNNLIQARTRGIFVNVGSAFSAYNNTIQLTQTSGGFLSQGIYVVSTNGVTSHTCNIYNNKIIQLATANLVAGSGTTGITIDNPGTYNIYNNMICGFDQTAASTLGIFQGIRSNSSSALLTLNIYYNTIVIPEDADLTGADVGGIAGIALANAGFAGSATIKNNIIMVSNNPTCFGIYRANAGGTFVSDYNDIYTPGTGGNAGAWNGTAQQTLALWQSASSQDANSKSVSVTFSAVNDLHLSGGSIGDGNLAAAPIIGFTTDIDGDTRNAYWPYMGVDEVTASPLTLKLTLKALIQGIYANSGTDDTLVVCLAKPSSPYTKYFPLKGLSSATGVDFYFPKSNNEASYYISIKNRNSIETWSASPITFPSGIATYDFTSAQAQSFGGNVVNVSGKWCIYNGDVVVDEFIDGSDVSDCFNDANIGASGYIITDLTGDDFVDGTDVSVAFNNANAGVGAYYPTKKLMKKNSIEIKKVEQIQE